MVESEYCEPSDRADLGAADPAWCERLSPDKCPDRTVFACMGDCYGTSCGEPISGLPVAERGYRDIGSYCDSLTVCVPGDSSYLPSKRTPYAYSSLRPLAHGKHRITLSRTPPLLAATRTLEMENARKDGRYGR